MTENPWDQWLRNWLNRNPLREPPEELQRDYVRQVMERIRPDPAPAREPMWRLWMQPRLALAGALAAAAVAVAVYRGPGIADTLERDSQILLEAGELALLNGTPLEEVADEELLQEIRAADEQEMALS